MFFFFLSRTCYSISLIAYGKGVFRKPYGTGVEFSVVDNGRELILPPLSVSLFLCLSFLNASLTVGKDQALLKERCWAFWAGRSFFFSLCPG